MMNINNEDLARQHAREIQEEIARCQLAEQFRREQKEHARLKRAAERAAFLKLKNAGKAGNAGKEPSFWQKLLTISRRML